jgi:hypothetical protein
LALQPNSGLGRLHETFHFTSVTTYRTVSRTPWTGDQLGLRDRLASVRAKTVHSLDPSATATGNLYTAWNRRCPATGVTVEGDLNTRVRKQKYCHNKCIVFLMCNWNCQLQFIFLCHVINFVN